MYLAEKSSGHLVEVLEPETLFNPVKTKVACRSHYGEEAQEPEAFAKSELRFPSGESLPRCWTDAHYRQE